jgi:hypothetical protein
LNSLFCRHNRFTADCPICSKGTLLDSSAPAARPRKPSTRPGGGRARASDPAARQFTGPYAAAGPYELEDGGRYHVRLEKVPGGVRLGQWSGGGVLQKVAPVLRAADLPALIDSARERSVLAERDQEALERALDNEPTGARADAGTSPGRAGDMREELRVEADGDGMLRVARWLYRPNFGWELQDAPVMLPAKRYAEALRSAVRAGLVEPSGQSRSTSDASPSTSRSTLTTPT